MSKFTSEQINELRELYKKELGLEVSADKASRDATQLVNLLRATYKVDDDFSDAEPP